MLENNVFVVVNIDVVGVGMFWLVACGGCPRQKSAQRFVVVSSKLLLRLGSRNMLDSITVASNTLPTSIA